MIRLAAMQAFFFLYKSKDSYTNLCRLVVERHIRPCTIVGTIFVLVIIMNAGYTISADYQHIDVALKSFWKPFNDLIREMDSFIARPLSDFDNVRDKEFERIRKLNPEMSIEQVSEFVSKQIEASYSDQWQFYEKFSDRFMTMYVTVTLLSQALCEAEINAILAIGLHEKGLTDQFAKLERDDIRTKWLKHPKKFRPNYDLSKDSGLFQTLDHLIEQRNAWMHHKIQLSVGEEKVLKGSLMYRAPYQEMTLWLKRYFSLPYDLAAHAHSLTHLTILFGMYFKRSPIPIADAHK